ncbi:MAG: hypothetical protein QW728_02330 [Thermoplasmata archaeon]
MSILDRVSIAQIIAIGLSLSFLILGVTTGGYLKSKSIASVVCLSCMGVNIKQSSFSKEFWVEYPKNHKKAGEIPSHPSWVTSELESKVVILFFHQRNCAACTEQWNDMVKAGLVSGDEWHPGPFKYSWAKLFVLDAGSDQNAEQALYIYDPDGKSFSTPTTAILFKSADNTIYWVSSDMKVPASDIENMALYAYRSMS